VCFTIAPHEEQDGTIACPLQTDATRACNGDTISQLATLRTRVQNLAESSWERYAQIDFYDWTDCPTTRVGDPATIRITFESAFCTGEGSDAGDCDPSNLDEPPWDEIRGLLGKSGTPTDVHLDYRRILAGVDDSRVIHVLGHALGFRHSRGSPTQNCPNSADYDARAGYRLADAFDPSWPDDLDSVMAPCPSQSGNRPADKLSGADIVALQSYYGRKPDGAMVGANGLCTAIRGNAVPGAVLETNACYPYSTFAWRFEPGDVGGHLRSLFDPALCMSASGPTMGGDATPLEVRSCADQDDQRFGLVGVEWKANGAFCVSKGDIFRGDLTTLYARYCDGSSDQKWDFFGPDDLLAGHIRLSGTNLCAAVPSEDYLTTDPLGVADCADDVRQRFRFPGQGAIAWADTDLCMNVSGGAAIPGPPIILWGGCSQRVYTNEKFHVSGPIKTLAAGVPSSCLLMQGGVGWSNPLAVGRCTGARDQNWDYYLYAP
jgi:hypothetical protein